MLLVFGTHDGCTNSGAASEAAIAVSNSALVGPRIRRWCRTAVDPVRVSSTQGAITHLYAGTYGVARASTVCPANGFPNNAFTFVRRLVVTGVSCRTSPSELTVSEMSEETQLRRLWAGFENAAATIDGSAKYSHDPSSMAAAGSKLSARLSVHALIRGVATSIGWKSKPSTSQSGPEKPVPVHVHRKAPAATGTSSTQDMNIGAPVASTMPLQAFPGRPEKHEDAGTHGVFAASDIEVLSRHCPPC